MIKSIKSFVLVLAIALIALPSTSIAQSVTSNIDLKTVNVDNLTDEQITNYMNQAAERGLTQSEAIALARQRGVSEVQLNKLTTRIAQIKSGASIGTANASQEKDNPANSASPTFALDTNTGIEGLSDTEKVIFGLGLFRRSGLSFAPNLNLPTPVDYVLGPGDELIVDLWGSTQQMLRFTISKEGTIRPQKVGPLYVNGLTIQEAADKVISRLSQVYSGLKKGNGKAPTIFYQVSLGSIRTINVEIIGSVEKPGIYSLPSLATVYTALHASGGPSVDGSMRSIRLVRDNKLLTTVDIYTFLTQGVKSGDLRLKNGDVIVIPPFYSRIAINGEVKLPGLFELKAGESFLDIFNYTNGFTNKAFKESITVKRNGDTERHILDIGKGDFVKYNPHDGDRIFVGSILNRYANRVVISGAVYRPGEFELTEGLTVKNLISKAEGLRADAYQKRATIYRIKDDFTQEIVSFDLEAVVNGLDSDLLLKGEDVVTINSIHDLGEEPYVQITGQVMKGGIYPYFNQMTVQDLIILAGGFKESATGSYIEIARRNNDGVIGAKSEILSLSIDKDLSLGQEEENALIQPFDQVYIRMSPGYALQENVTIEGEVFSPGDFSISKRDERISDIVARAQGLTPYAYPKGAILIRKSEFDVREESGVIAQSLLEEVRDKVLSGQSELKNEERSVLISRIDKLRSEGENSSSLDEKGSTFKRRLLQGNAVQDSLIERLDLGRYEPVTLNLDEIMKSPGSKYDLIVRSGDIISIPPKLETVRVSGEVLSPLNVRYDADYSLRDYIDLSGGFRSTAKRGKIVVQYPNGERMGVKRFLFFRKFPKVEPGSTIIVSRKPEREPLNFQAAIATAGTIATLVLVVDRLGGN